MMRLPIVGRSLRERIPARESSARRCGNSPPYASSKGARLDASPSVSASQILRINRNLR